MKPDSLWGQRVIAVIALVVLGGIMLAGFYWERANVARNETDRLLTQAKVIRENIDQNLTALNQVLEIIRAQVPQGLESGTFNDYLRAITDAMPGVRTVVVIDANGNMLASNWPEMVGINVSSRLYFLAVKQHPDAETIYVSPPFRTRKGMYVMNISRMLTDLNGAFAGIVTATLDPNYFSPLLDSVRYRPDMSVTLLHWDGDVFLSQPSTRTPEDIPSLIADPAFSEHRRNGRAVSIFPQVRQGEEDMRMVLQQTIRPSRMKLDKPMVVRIERSSSQVFRAWKRELHLISAMYLLLFGASVWGIQRFQRRHLEAEQREAEAVRSIAASETLMKTITDHLPAMIAYWTDELKCRFANGAYYDWFGKTPEQMRGISMRELLGEDLFRKNEPHARAVLRGEPQQFERTLTKADGSVGYTWAQYIPDVSDGRVAGFFVLVSDVTPLMRAQKALAESEWKLKTIIQTEPECVAILRADGTIEQMNPAGMAMIGAASEQQAIGVRLPELIDPQYHDEILALLADVSRGESRVRMFELIDFNNARHWLECHAVPMRDKEKCITGLLCVIRDMTDRKRAEMELQHMAQTDFLTGLCNRRHFLSQAEQELHRSHRYGGPLTVMMIDIDHFKNVNDSYGHKAGDTVLRSFADLCRSSLRSVDIIGRLGGEEFAVLLPETDSDHATAAANLLIQRASQLRIAAEAGRIIRFTVSIGVASRAEADNDLESLLSEADHALYEAKHSGRNKVCKFRKKPVSA